MGKEEVDVEQTDYITYCAAGGYNTKYPKKKLIRSKAIRFKCLDCSGGQQSEVKNCVVPDCPLYPFRMGKKEDV